MMCTNTCWHLSKILIETFRVQIHPPPIIDVSKRDSVVSYNNIYNLWMRQINCSKWWWCESFYLFTMHYVQLSLSLSLVCQACIFWFSITVLVVYKLLDKCKYDGMIPKICSMVIHVICHILWILNLRELPLRLLLCGYFLKYTLMRSIMPPIKP